MLSNVKSRFVEALRETPEANHGRGAELLWDRTLPWDTAKLDVLAVLAGVFILSEETLPPIHFVPARRAEHEYYFYLRPELIAWSGLTDTEMDLLLEMNDERGLTFAEIADEVAAWAS